METITETPNWTECRNRRILWSTVPIDGSASQLPQLWLRGHYGRMAGNGKSKNTKKSSMRQSLLKIGAKKNKIKSITISTDILTQEGDNLTESQS